MIVLSPEGKAQTAATRVAALPRFTDLNGKVVGLLDNSKPNADKLEERFAQLLRERLDVARVVTRRKISAQQGAPREYLDELAVPGRFCHQRPGRLRLVHVVEYPRLNRTTEARQVCRDFDHPRVRCIGEV